MLKPIDSGGSTDSALSAPDARSAAPSPTATAMALSLIAA